MAVSVSGRYAQCLYSRTCLLFGGSLKVYLLMYMYVLWESMCTRCMQVPSEARGYQIPWGWSYRYGCWEPSLQLRISTLQVSQNPQWPSAPPSCDCWSLQRRHLTLLVSSLAWWGLSCLSFNNCLLNYTSLFEMSG